MTMDKDDVRVSIVFMKTSRGPVLDVMHWSSEFADKMDIISIDYDQFWSETSSRVEFQGTYKEKS
jgi:hypothetical protein